MAVMLVVIVVMVVTLDNLLVSLLDDVVTFSGMANPSG